MRSLAWRTHAKGSMMAPLVNDTAAGNLRTFTSGMLTNSAKAPGGPVIPSCSPKAPRCESPVAQYSDRRPALAEAI